MAILERYRRKSAGPGYHRAIIYGGLLLAAAGAFFMAGRRDAPRAPRARTDSSTYRPEAAAPPLPGWRPLSSIDERKLLGHVVDQRPLGVREHAQAYYYFLKKAHHVTEAELEAEVNPEVTYASFIDEPSIVRGSAVRVRGALLRLARTPLGDPGKAGLSAVYEGQILSADNRVYSFVLTEPPQAPYEPGRVRMRDGLRVGLAGFFLQVIVYANRQTPPVAVATPLIIGRRLAPLKRAASARGVSWPWLLLGVAVLAWLAFRMTWAVVGRRRPREPAAD